MSQSKLAQRPRMNERLVLVVPPALKRSLFEVAAQRGRSVADVTREAIAAVVHAAA